MYRLLIVDDEPIIVDWLYDLFLASGLDLDIYKAYSGIEALEWLKRAKIEIVLSDIKMPGMTGLQLTQHIHSSWPSCKVIFLSAYDNFDYVYEAIKKEGIRYLLKTEDDKVIINAIEKAIEELDNNSQLDNLFHQANQQMLKVLPLLQKEFMMSIIHGEIADIQERVEYLKELNFPLEPTEPLLLLLGKIDNHMNKKTAADRTKIISRIQVTVETYFITHLNSFFITCEDGILLWVLQLKRDERNLEWEQAVNFIKGTLESVQKALRDTVGVTTSYIIDKGPCQWENLTERFHVLKLMCNYTLGLTKELILSYSDEHAKQSQKNIYNISSIQDIHMQLEKVKILETYLESGQKDNYVNLFCSIESQINKQILSNHHLYTEIYYSFALMFLTYLNRWNTLHDTVLDINPNSLMNVNEHINNDIFRYFMDISEQIFRIQSEEKVIAGNIIIKNIQNYINEHINEDLSLVRLSELVYLNPIYLSRLYKKETGSNLSDYINEIRLMKAKGLLIDSNLKIYEIAKAVGYESAQYFNRIFKRNINMTPQEFRDSFLSNTK